MVSGYRMLATEWNGSLARYTGVNRHSCNLRLDIHSRDKISCPISRNSAKGKPVEQFCAIIWDGRLGPAADHHPTTARPRSDHHHPPPKWHETQRRPASKKTGVEGPKPAAALTLMPRKRLLKPKARWVAAAKKPAKTTQYPI